MPLGTKVGLGPDHIVLDGDSAHPQKRGTVPRFQHMSTVAKQSPISATAEHLLHLHSRNVPDCYGITAFYVKRPIVFIQYAYRLHEH